MGESRLPLAGVKVIELASFVAAPACGKLLADWGAEVLKVEAPRGDPFRSFGTTYRVTCTEEENPLFDQYNGGKRSLSLDLNHPEGYPVLEQLLNRADVFLTNLRPKALSKLGLDYDSLRARCPRLVYASVSGYGEKGPKKDAPGFDAVAFWASSGFLADLAVSSPGSYPVGVSGGVGDIATGAALFGGICAALYKRRETGLGDKVSLSLYGAALWFMSMMNMSTQPRYNNPYPRTRYQGNPLGCPYQTGDGEWIVLTILEYEKQFPVLCSVLGTEHLLRDPRFQTQGEALKPDNRKVLIETFEEAFAQKSTRHWTALLTENDLVHDKLAHFHEAIGSEQAAANQYTADHEMPGGAHCIVVPPALRSEAVGIPPVTCGPLLGQDTGAVLRELGYTPAEIAALERRGTVVQNKKITCNDR